MGVRAAIPKNAGLFRKVEVNSPVYHEGRGALFCPAEAGHPLVPGSCRDENHPLDWEKTQRFFAPLPVAYSMTDVEMQNKYHAFSLGP